MKHRCLFHYSLIFIIISVFIVLSTNVTAEWTCGSQTLNDCSNPRPIECCVDNNVPVCLTSNGDCNQVCSITGERNSWDDFGFCPLGQTAYCDVTTEKYYNYGYSHSTDNMACCENSLVWSDSIKSCVPPGIECIGDRTGTFETLSLCDGSPFVTCTDDSQCAYDSSNRECVSGECCRYVDIEILDVKTDQCEMDEICNLRNSKCEKLDCGVTDWTCVDDSTRSRSTEVPDNHECVTSTMEFDSCDINSKCSSGNCQPIVCDDGDICTSDFPVNGLCTTIFNDADFDGLCDPLDECPDVFGTLETGCSSNTTSNQSEMIVPENNDLLILIIISIVIVAIFGALAYVIYIKLR